MSVLLPVVCVLATLYSKHFPFYACALTPVYVFAFAMLFFPFSLNVFALIIVCVLSLRATICGRLILHYS